MRLLLPGETSRDLKLRSAVLALGALLVSLASACGDNPVTAAPEGEGPLVSDADTVLRALGAAVHLSRFLRRPDASDNLRVSVTQERRWLSNEPVLDQGALEEQRLVRSRAPGSLRLHLVTPAESVLVKIEVALPRPALLGYQMEPPAEGAIRVELIGYRLDEVDSLQIASGSGHVVVEGADSAHLRLLVPRPPFSQDCDDRQRLSLSLPADDPRGVLPITFAPNPVDDLAVGEYRELPAGVRCFSAHLEHGAELAVAYLDARWIRSLGVDGIELRPEERTAVRIRIVGRSLASRAPIASPVQAVLRSQAGSRPEVLETTSRTMLASEPCPSESDDWETCDAPPWQVGDRFSVGQVDTARVVAVNGPMVTAVEEATEVFLGGEEGIGRLRDLSSQVSQAFPFFEGAMGGVPPETRKGTGQFIVLVEGLEQPRATGATVTGIVWQGSGPPMLQPWVYIGTDSTYLMDHEYLWLPLYWVALHEVAHAFQARHRTFVISPRLEGNGSGGTWAREGGATLMAGEVLRREWGIPLLKNLDMPLRWPGLLAFGDRDIQGDFLSGYGESTSFLRDLVARLMLQGELPYEEAMEEVLQGSLEGFFGTVDRPVPGLTERMRRYLGADWDPEEALVTWLLTQILDDISGDPELQNRVFRDAYQALPALGSLAGDTSTLEAERPMGSVGWIRIRGTGDARVWELDAAPAGRDLPGGVRWIIARRR